MKRVCLKHLLHKSKKNWLFFIIFAFWFIIRVIPNPFRAVYPCQQAFLKTVFISLQNIFIPIIAIIPLGIRRQFTKKNLVLFGIFLLVIGGIFYLTSDSRKFWEKEEMVNVYNFETDQPTGVSKNALIENYPHRVVSVHDSDATSWDFQCTGTGSCPAYYGSDVYVNQQKVDEMVDAGLMELTGTTDIVSAWQEIIPNYVAGEEVAIKVNFNDAITGGTWGYTDSDAYVDAIPQPVKSLIRGLKLRGVAEEDIWIYDASRFVTNRFRSIVYEDYPQVLYFDHYGTGTNPPTYLATFNSADPSAQVDFITSSYSGTHRISDVLVNAEYLIDMPILKRHVGAITSLSFKNHLGTIDQMYDGSGSPEDTLHAYVYPSGGSYTVASNPLIDVYSNSNIRDKTVLIVGEGLYGTRVQNNEPPSLWVSFGNDSPNIIFFSVDPVAVDSVMLDYLWRENDANPVRPMNSYADDVLLLADAANLGVFESWNNDYDRDYVNIDYVELEAPFAGVGTQYLNCIEATNAGVVPAGRNCVEITGCRALNSGSDYYLMIQDINSASGNCFNVQSNNVIFNGNGHLLTFGNSGTGNAFYYSGGYSNFELFGINVTQGVSGGSVIFVPTNFIIDGLHLHDSNFVSENVNSNILDTDYSNSAQNIEINNNYFSLNSLVSGGAHILELDLGGQISGSIHDNEFHMGNHIYAGRSSAVVIVGGSLGVSIYNNLVYMNNELQGEGFRFWASSNNEIYNNTVYMRCTDCRAFLIDGRSDYNNIHDNNVYADLTGGYGYAFRVRFGSSYNELYNNSVIAIGPGGNPQGYNYGEKLDEPPYTESQGNKYFNNYVETHGYGVEISYGNNDSNIYCNTYNITGALSVYNIKGSSTNLIDDLAFHNERIISPSQPKVNFDLAFGHPYNPIEFCNATFTSVDITGGAIEGVDYILTSAPCTYQCDSSPSVGNPDVNSDGSINIIDLALATYWQGKNVNTEPRYSHLDLNKDGVVNWQDVWQIIIRI